MRYAAVLIAIAMVLVASSCGSAGKNTERDELRQRAKASSSELKTATEE